MTTLGGGLMDFVAFGLKEARASLFAGGFFFLLFLSRQIPLGDLARYDFLFLAALGIQGVLLALREETWQEARVILIFHLVGLLLELYKTQSWVGSWSYPEPGFFKVAGVPLYSGFMYAAVGSYIMAAWRLLNLRFQPSPPMVWSLVLCILIYLNFFTNRWIMDFRWYLLAGVLVVFGRTWVTFIPRKKEYRMPLVLAFVLIGFFIWVGENIATLFGAWQYPDQSDRWNPVSLGKISSWGLLVIISFVIVALWKQGSEVGEQKKPPAGKEVD